MTVSQGNSVGVWGGDPAPSNWENDTIHIYDPTDAFMSQLLLHSVRENGVRELE